MEKIAMFKSADETRTYLLAGHATVTVSSQRTGARYTYRVTRAKDEQGQPRDLWFVGLLSGPDNEANYTYVGAINGSFKLTKKSRMSADSTPVKTLTALVRRRGEEEAAALLRLLATRAPVTANEIRALDILKHDLDFRDDWDEERAGQIVRASSDYERREAEAIALTHERPLCRALALVWHRQMPRRRAEPQLVRRTTT